MKALTGVGLVGVAFVGGWILGAREAWQVSADIPEVMDESALVEENARMRQRIASQRERIAALETSFGEANAKLAKEVKAAEEVQAPANPFRRQMESRIQRRVEVLAERLGLTELQKAGLGGVFMRRLEHFESRRSGVVVEPFNLDAELEAVLSPEQFAQYMEETQEEIYNRAELIATGQLVRMNQLLELDASVQGIVYDAVHVTAQEMMIARETGANFSMREALDERLGTVLTEDQMRVLREEGDGFGGGSGMAPGALGRGGRGP